jgi:DNA-directed RNA polymerase subunit RPC12/RpoP
MQTVNFQCGHCGKLMGVAQEFLGRQVRCPHCQQVVVAPAPGPAAPPPAPAPAPHDVETVFQPQPTGDHEDIFAPSEEATDDLFGRSSAPRLEMPAEPAPPPDPVSNGTSTIPGAMADAFAPTLAFSPPDAPAPGSPGTPALELPPSDGGATQSLPPPGPGGIPSWMTPTVHETPADHGASAPPPESHAEAAAEMSGGPSEAVARAARRTQARGTGWFWLLVFVPLVFYSILMTVVVVLLLLKDAQVQAPRDPFDKMIDDGDNSGVKPAKGRKGAFHWNPGEAYVTQELPAHLRTTLGKPIRVGDLEVTPKEVTRERVKVMAGAASNAEPCLQDSLVLHLHVRNVSSDLMFAPLDPYFDRFWKPGMEGPPFTYLQAGKYRFFGGPARWWKRDQANPNPPEWVEGRRLDDPGLEPGEERDTLVCTDGGGPDNLDPAAPRILFGTRTGKPYHGPLHWRIRVRRGLVQHKGRDLSATAVIGVDFTDKDIQARASKPESD